MFKIWEIIRFSISYQDCFSSCLSKSSSEYCELFLDNCGDSTGVCEWDRCLAIPCPSSNYSKHFRQMLSSQASSQTQAGPPSLTKWEQTSQTAFKQPDALTCKSVCPTGHSVLVNPLGNLQVQQYPYCPPLFMHVLQIFLQSALC